MIEAGGGLSLAIGMAVSGQTRSATQCSPATVVTVPGQFGYTRVALPSTAAATRPATMATAATGRPATVVDWLAAQGGRAITSRRKLADVLGRRPTALADELQRLSIAGASGAPGVGVAHARAT